MTDDTKGVPEEQKQEEKKPIDIETTQKPNIVLTMAINGETGETEWIIPKDLKTAIFMLKHLDMVITDMHRQNVMRQMQAEKAQKPDIMGAMRRDPIIRSIIR